MKKKSIKTLAIAIIGFAIASCSLLKKEEVVVTGSGTIDIKEFTITDYSEVTLVNNQEIYYEQRPDLEPYVRIEADANLLRYITPIVKKNVLTFTSLMKIDPTTYKVYTNSRSLSTIRIAESGKIFVEGILKVKDLTIDLSGTGNIVIDQLQSKNATVKLSGSGAIEIKSGITSDATYNITGSGNIKAFGFEAKEAICKISGSGNIWANANETLLTNISGSGDIHYTGKPLTIKNKNSGIGKVTEMTETTE